TAATTPAASRLAPAGAGHARVESDGAVDGAHLLIDLLHLGAPAAAPSTTASASASASRTHRLHHALLLRAQVVELLLFFGVLLELSVDLHAIGVAHVHLESAAESAAAPAA